MQIPNLRNRDGFKSIEIVECAEPLVNARGAHNKVHIQAMYRKWGITTSLDSVFVRQGVMDRLIAVADSLPEHIHLLLWDGWRPVTVHQALFDGYVTDLMVQNPSLSLERLRNMALDFVSLPSKDPSCPSTHATGGAIDLTLCTSDGIPLNLGTEFDDFSDKSNTRYFEDHQYLIEKVADNEVRNLRRQLFHSMISQGFTNFPNEWWHYDYGNQWWAVITGTGEKAKYGYIELGL